LIVFNAGIPFDPQYAGVVVLVTGAGVVEMTEGGVVVTGAGVVVVTGAGVDVGTGVVVTGAGVVEVTGAGVVEMTEGGVVVTGAGVVVVTVAGVGVVGAEVTPELQELQAGTDSREVGVHWRDCGSHTAATGIQEPVVQV